MENNMPAQDTFSEDIVALKAVIDSPAWAEVAEAIKRAEFTFLGEERLLIHVRAMAGMMPRLSSVVNEQLAAIPSGKPLPVPPPSEEI